MGLHPSFEKRSLPETGMSFWTHLSLWILKHVFDEFGLIDPSAPRWTGGKDISDIRKKRPVQKAQGRDREIPLWTVDHLRGKKTSCGLLQNVFAATSDFEFCWYVRSQLDELMVEKRHPRFQPKRHRHVVDPLDRIINQHNLAVDL